MVYALAGGTASIFISDPAGASTICQVQVEVDVTDISVSKDIFLLVDLYRTNSLKASVLPDSATDKNITWSSSDESVAQVDENGNVTMLSTGTAVISAVSHNGLFDTCEVVCIGPDVTLSLPAAMTELQDEALSGTCAKAIVIPATVETIGSQAFSDSPVLQALIFLGDPASIADDILTGTGDITVFCPTDSAIAAWAQNHNCEVEYR